jgi:hypothetical protein
MNDECGFADDGRNFNTGCIAAIPTLFFAFLYDLCAFELRFSVSDLTRTLGEKAAWG